MLVTLSAAAGVGIGAIVAAAPTILGALGSFLATAIGVLF